LKEGIESLGVLIGAAYTIIYFSCIKMTFMGLKENCKHRQILETLPSVGHKRDYWGKRRRKKRIKESRSGERRRKKQK
jgi:hypothetical protein